ncbi:uncharacterized protein LOC117100557 [Anneissia japonica]|uniref:uncharacterized protein LOC117100557 n=1 Tax=Anneissia japonica TaxID=1529436 RepID=UPI00142557F8|nr:uncharacterized protein LOC117100557 [Anneissia japonica]
MAAEEKKIKILVERGGLKEIYFITPEDDVKEVLKIGEDDVLLIFDSDFQQYCIYNTATQIKHLDKFKIKQRNDMPSTSAASTRPAGKRSLEEILLNVKGQSSKQKHTSLKRNGCCRITFGWMHRIHENTSHIGVRYAKGGGTRCLSVQQNATYDELTEIAKAAFLPEGKSPFCRIEDIIIDGIGTFQQLQSKEGFSLQEIINLHGNPSRTRIYLFSTKKIVTTTSESPQLSSDHDETDSLESASSLPDVHLDSPQCVTESIDSLPDVHGSPPRVNGLEFSTETMEWEVPANSGTPTVTFKLNMKSCHICCDRDINSFLLPCGHTMCLPCATHLQINQEDCPFCKEIIQSVKPLYQ